MLKRRFLWGALIASALVLCLLDYGAGSLILLVSVAVIPPCMAAPLLTRGRVKLELTCPERGARQQELKLVLTVENGGRMPEYNGFCRIKIENLFTGEVLYLPAEWSVGARSRAELSFAFSSEHCGALILSADKAELRDPFGLFARNIEAPAVCQCLITPRVSALTAALLTRTDPLSGGDRYCADTPGSDPGETLQIREYLPGDPVRQIHWKLSEKSDRVMLREFGLPLASELLILADTTLPEPFHGERDTLDTVLDVLYSLCAALLDAQLPFVLGRKANGSDSVELCEVACVQELDAAMLKIMSARAECAVASVCECLSPDQLRLGFAHIAVVTGARGADSALFFGGAIVTTLLAVSNEHGVQTPDAITENTLIISRNELERGMVQLEL